MGGRERVEYEGGRLQAPIKAPSGRLDQMHTPEQEMPEKGRSESKDQRSMPRWLMTAQHYRLLVRVSAAARSSNVACRQPRRHTGEERDNPCSRHAARIACATWGGEGRGQCIV